MTERSPGLERDPSAPSRRLPLPLTRFVGRQRELARLRRLVGEVRLVTLTGAGGSGKTRLAQELAAGLGAEFPAGVHLVELAPLGEGELVAEQVASALGVRAKPGGSTVDAIVASIGDRRLLLVLDNCEHVIAAAAALADALLRRCERLVILATSREALAIVGETAWLVPPLSLPDAAAPLRPEALERSEAVRLFLDRAADALPDFALSDANAATVAGICRRLDGIPLALELAAARMRLLGPEQLLARLDDRFRVLTSGARTALPRHRTLRAAMDWSYELLATAERRLLERLSVFTGGFALEAAERICAGDDVAEEAVLELVSTLVDKSLVEVVEHGAEARYRLLETVRQYAAERLAESGGPEWLARRHAAFFLALAAAAEPHLTTPERRPWIARLSRDADNLRQALAWTRAAEPLAHVRMAGLLCWYWFATENWSEGRQWLESALALPEAAAPTRERAAALFAAGVLTSLQGRGDIARPLLEESRGVAAALGDARQEAYARNYLGLSLAAEARPEAVEHLQAALAYFRSAHDLYGGRLALLNLGSLAAVRGELEQAYRYTAEGVEAARAFRQDRETAISLRQLAMVELRRGAPERAVAHAREALEAIRRDPQHWFAAISLEMMAAALCDLGRPLDAARLFGAGERIREAIGSVVLPIDAALYEPRVAAARARAGEEAFRGAWDAGRELRLDDAIAAALRMTQPQPEAPSAVASAAHHPERAPAVAPAAATRPAPPAGDRVALRVLALGPLEVYVDGERLDPSAWSHARPRELLLHLLCHPAGRTREQIGLTFWPDSSAAQVKNSFHVALHHLRKTLGRHEWVSFENDRYRANLELGCFFDAAELEARFPAAVRAVREREPGAVARLASLLALYRGDFLAEESAGDWHLEHRDHLRSLCLDGLLTLGGALLDEGSHAEAADVFRRALRIENLNEEAHRRLMVAHARMGERAAAIRHYERLVALLQHEYAAEPEPRTIELHRALLRAEAL